ncbi:MAG TPA: apolipoprotein N-acyltransferase, partial [Treponemataceae bacterium]|nr:apolipoprotein N-acyltransferase [Treponemataceae bacterium]
MKKNLINFFLLLIGIFLFALPQPSFIFPQGLPFLAYFSFIPLFMLIHRVSWKTICLWGLAYGVGAYNIFTYWLSSFHPLGMALISGLYGFQFVLLFPLLKVVPLLIQKHAWLVQWLVWCAYEYIKTIGYAGFNYGVSAYSQWRYVLVIQCVEIIGVWGLGAIISFSSVWLAQVLKDSFECNNCKSFMHHCLVKIKNHRVSGIVWVCVFVMILIYGKTSQVDYSQNETAKVALMQTNTDPWKGGTNHYRNDLNTLIRLSDRALSEHSDIDFIVWPETAFIPKIEWHYKYREDQERYELVKNLLNYIDSKDVPFLIGNDHGVLAHRRDGTFNSVDYNAALLFTPKKNVLPPNPDKYFKVKLVPFTEYFPYEKMFPTIYKALLNGDTHMWSPGEKEIPLKIKNFKAGTPICFEDTFGFVIRNFVNNGAQVIVNVSNDAWSKSAACQYQHLSMAVFRCVENRVPAVRSTSSGQTAIIDPNGNVQKMLEPFTQNYLVGEFPIMDTSKKTFYTTYG